MHNSKTIQLITVLGKERYIYSKFTILFFLLVSPSLFFGQELEYSIKQLSLEDGLSQVTINDVLVDNSGFSWIATQDGLNRFDGTNFKQFRYNELDSLTVAGQFINTLVEDLEGRIWVGSLGNGLSFYNKKKDIFLRVSLQYSNKKTETINDLAVDRNGAIWVASSFSGLHKLSPVKKDTFLQENYFAGQWISSIYVDDDEIIWIGNQHGEIYQLDSKQDNSYMEVPFFTIKGEVNVFYRQGDYLYIGTHSGLYRYNLHTKNTVHIELNKNGEDANKNIKSFLPKGKNELWVGTESGLFLLDLHTNKTIVKIHAEEKQLDKKLSNNHVYCLTQLTSNQMLVGTYNSLNIVQISPSYFKTISKDKRGQHLLNDNVVMSILRENNNLWVGTSNYLNLITKDTTYIFKENQKDPFSLPGKGILSIKKDTLNDRIWIATIHGLAMIQLKTFNPENPKFQVFRNNPKDSNSINGDFVKDIAFDVNNNLWGVGRNGMFQLQYNNEKDFQFRRFFHDANDMESLGYNLLNNITIDSTTFWLGSYDGIIKVDFENTDYQKPKFTTITKIDSLDASISSNSIMKIFKDKKQRIWVGTGHGLNLHKKNSTFKSWVYEKQFPNPLIYSIEEGVAGNLWMGTSDGLVKFNPETERFLHYGIEDGIQNKEFNERASFRDSDGTMYFGGIGGISIFNPENLKNIDIPKPLYFSELKVKDKVVNVYNSPKKWLTTAIESTENLHFAYNDFPFYLNFSSVDYRFHKDVSFAYKLLPTDTEWHVLNDLEIQFLNLPAGDYTLLVNGFSRGKEWEQSPLEMKITIGSPWWATWVAYFCYALLIAVLGYSFYRFQLDKKMVQAESKRLRDIDQLKNSLYTNITHEFRTPLTVILGMADSLKTNLKEREFSNAENAIDMIKRNGGNLLHLINEMLDLAKLESGTMELQLVQLDVIPYVKYIGESFHSLAEEKNITLTIYSEIDELIMDIDTNKMLSILTNLLSNAIKFTQENGKIVVHLKHTKEKESSFFTVKIKDDGLGISKKDLPNIFDRFYQVDASTSRSEEGTGIGLSLVKELVIVMNGSIGVESKLGKGSTFYFKIPVFNSAIPVVNYKKDIKSEKFPFSSEDTNSNHLPNGNKMSNSELPLALLIEDNKDVAYYLETCLKGKYQTIHALNGAIGIEMAFERIPDIIICDVMMPEKDGFEVCGILKKDERTDHIPIILLTAKVTVKDRIIGLSRVQTLIWQSRL